MKHKIIYKYLNGEASEKSIQQLFEWIEESPENKNEFIKLKKAWALSAHCIVDDNKAWNSIERELFPKNKKPNHWFKYAAVLAVFIGISSLFYYSNQTQNAVTDVIVLESADGFKTEIKSDQSKILTDQSGKQIAEQHEDEIIYSNQNSSSTKQITYNTLKIPYGKTFKVTLSDGTRVQLNSGTTFTYPESFPNTGKRHVTLIGEAFFEVTENKSQPFIVGTDSYNIEVLGTKFNVSAYQDDHSSNTVLVEGSVKLTDQNNASNSKLLKPNEKGVWNSQKQLFEVTTIDSYSHTAWTRGELAFENASFDRITKKLERSLNVSIQNNNPNLSQQQFTGTLKIKGSDITTILDLLKVDTLFDYDINGNQVIIHNAKSQ